MWLRASQEGVNQRFIRVWRAVEMRIQEVKHCKLQHCLIYTSCCLDWLNTGCHWEVCHFRKCKYMENKCCYSCYWVYTVNHQMSYWSFSWGNNHNLLWCYGTCYTLQIFSCSGHRLSSWSWLIARVCTVRCKPQSILILFLILHC